MLSQQIEPLTEEAIVDYLSNHPDFFLKNPTLLDRLVLSYRQKGAISLVEIQQQRQRQRIEALEKEIAQLMSVASNNDRTFYQFMDLQTQLFKSRSLKQAIQSIDALASKLDLIAYIRLINEETSLLDLTADQSSQHGVLTKENWQRFSSNHLNGKEAYLGRLRKADRAMLFSECHTPEMGSFVILPLTIEQKPLGLLGFSSKDGGHFQPNMDTLFLRQLTLLLSHLIDFFQWKNEHNQVFSHVG